MSKVITNVEYLNILKKYSSHFRDLMKIVRNSGYELRGAVENPSEIGKKDLLNKQMNLYFKILSWLYFFKTIFFYFIIEIFLIYLI